MLIVCWLALLVAHTLSLVAQERITTFTSDIIVNTDATVQVQETIEVISAGKGIVHGIVREFPTSYVHHHVINYSVDFNVQSVTQNGDPALFWIESIANGKKLYIGEKSHRIPVGKHTYTITYTTNRQLGFFSNNDELYWNVTGNGWRLPIDRVDVSIQLPSQVPSASITAEGYTGFQSERGKEYTYAVKNNRINFSTTQRLQPYEGLTVVVTWPKGFVQKPSWYQEWVWFLKDNLLIIGTLLTLFLLLVLIFSVLVMVRRKNKPGTVIPLFYPPEGFTPSDVGFMKAKKFKNQLFAADIVHLAVQGFITISFTPGKIFGRGTYTLKLIKDPANKESHSLSYYEVALLSVLFGDNKDRVKELVIDGANSVKIDVALQKASRHGEQQTSAYITTLSTFLYCGYAVCAVWFVGVLLLGLFDSSRELLVPCLVFFVAMVTIITRFYQVYTLQGRKIQDQIDGFELYLTTAETERMNVIGTLPTRTPELYEKYLPYAIALGVEKQWTEQFASLFATLAQQGHTYTPNWYVGGPFKVHSFASHVGSSLSSAISSSSTPPGKSSGSRGGGSSGGGGGGGGGGGW